MSENTQITPAPRGPMLVHLADKLIGRPLLMHPTKTEMWLHVLHERIGIGADQLEPLSPDANRFIGSRYRNDSFHLNKSEGGVAFLPIVGSLVNRGAWVGASSGLVSYEGISAQLREIKADPDIHSVLMDIDSPGGEATGMFACAEQIRELSETKTVIAFVNDMAASAAYGLASAASEIVVSPTSIVGSIGVVLTHFDRSGELEQKGVKPTLIYAGENKVDGNPFGPLSDKVKSDLNAEVGKFYDKFVSLVATGRGDRLTEEAARATQARTFLGEEAVERGLADRVASLDAVLASLQSAPPAGANSNRNGSFSMSNDTNTPAATITQEAHDQALAAARAEGVKEGATAAKERIGAILGCEAAKTRGKLAMSLAMNTEMTAEEAEKVLADAAEEKPAASQTVGLSLEERADGLEEFGAQGNGDKKAEAKEKAASGWAAAVNSANAGLGVN